MTTFDERLHGALQAVTFLHCWHYTSEQLGLMLHAVRSIATTTCLGTQVHAALRIARLVALATPSTADDIALAIVDKIIVGPTFTVLVAVVSQMLSTNVEGVPATPPGVNVQAVEAAGVPWTQLVGLARFVTGLIKTHAQQTGEIDRLP